MSIFQAMDLSKKITGTLSDAGRPFSVSKINCLLFCPKRRHRIAHCRFSRRDESADQSQDHA